MRLRLLTAPTLLAGVLALAACTSQDPAPSGVAQGSAAHGLAQPHAGLRSPEWTPRAVADLPDRGTLLAYTGSTPIRHSAYTWHGVHISEEHALRAIASGEMTIDAPDGTPIRLKYDHHVEHADGNWTWVGRPDGAQPGTEAIITFGDKAVFGTVPHRAGKPLRIGSSHGRTWVMETNMKGLAKLDGIHPEGPDFVVPPALAGARDRALSMAAAKPQSLTASGAVPESATIDLVIGYTNTFASRLGGTSQAVTRLTFLTDVANQAFTNSQVVAKLRLVGTVAVNYPDATNNQTALYELTGVSCTDTPAGLDCSSAPVPAALQPLVALRDSKHADLMSLVRNFSDPENEGCGIAWLLGGGMVPISGSDAGVGVSVVSDSNGDGGLNDPVPFPDNGYVCRDETFAHEIGHNMGSAHDQVTAAGDDGVLDSDERGAYWYSLGYKATNYFTVMAYGDSGQTSYRVFSNPRITYCGNNACGVTDEADNARSLTATAPIIAAFAVSVAGSPPRSDFDGNGSSDLLWRNLSSGENQIWRSANAATKQAIAPVGSTEWTIVGTGDFDADGRADIVWRNTANGQNTIWRAGSHTTQTTVSVVPDQNWRIVGIGDFDGDGHDDLLWRHTTSGTNAIWRSANSATQTAVAPVGGTAWKVAGVGDFNGDGRDDILWRNSSTGANTIWRSGSNAAQQSMPLVPDQNWRVAGIGDFDGDGLDDVLWRHGTSGANQIWRSANSTTQQAIASVGNPAWIVADVGDFDGDGRDDVLWRNVGNGANEIWKSANAATKQAVPTVSSGAWVVHS